MASTLNKLPICRGSIKRVMACGDRRAVLLGSPSPTACAARVRMPRVSRNVAWAIAPWTRAPASRAACGHSGEIDMRGQVRRAHFRQRIAEAMPLAPPAASCRRALRGRPVVDEQGGDAVLRHALRRARSASDKAAGHDLGDLARLGARGAPAAAGPVCGPRRQQGPGSAHRSARSTARSRQPCSVIWN